MHQRGRRVQADQVVADRADGFVNLFQRIGERLVRPHQRRQLQAEERNRLARCAEGEPAEQRHRDQEGVQRQVHQPGQALLPHRWRRPDRRRRSRPEADRQPHEDQREHAEAQHEVPGLQALAQVAAARIEAAQFDAGIHGDQQQQHQPVHADRQRAVAVSGVFPVHGDPCRWVAGDCRFDAVTRCSGLRRQRAAKALRAT